MGDIIQQIGDLFEEVLTLDDSVEVWQIVVLVSIVIASFVVAEHLRRWFGRFFNRLKVPQTVANRLCAILFLLIMIIGISLAFNTANIKINLLGDVLDYDLTRLFQPSQKPVETETGEVTTPIDVDTYKGQLTIARLFYGFVIILGMFILSKYAQWVLRLQVLRAFQVEKHTQFIILRFFHFTMITIGVLISLRTFGVNFTNLAIIFGGLSIGIGFGLQNLVSNLISGLILIFEHPIKIGDLVEIIDVNIFGRVSSINLRSTVIVSVDEKEIIVPNSQLITEPIHNLTHYNNRFRVRVPVGVSYGSDVNVVKKALLEAAQAHPEVIKAPPDDMENVTEPFIRFVNFGDSSLDFELLAWIPDSFQRFDVASDLHFLVWDKLKAYNIKIPFPQRDVHFLPTEKQE